MTHRIIHYATLVAKGIALAAAISLLWILLALTR
jgi:hypothetical protein